LAAAVAAAQDKPPDSLPALEQAAEKRTTEWDTLAGGLAARIAGLLPCDPRVQSAIEEVSRASDARVAALQQYFQAVAAKAKEQTEAAKRLLIGQESIATEGNSERAETELARAGIEVQITALIES